MDENGDAYYYYDNPRNNMETHNDRSTGFYISWSGTKPFAITHTHGAYDANTGNTKDGFSSPGNSLNPNGSDAAGSAASGLDYYAVTPNGNLRKYTANSDNFEGILIRLDMPVDSRIAIHQGLKKTLVWNLIKNRYPNVSDQDIVNASRNHPDNWMDALTELKNKINKEKAIGRCAK